MMVKVYKYSIKSEAEIHGYTIKKLFRRNLKISQKRNLFMDLFLNKVTGLHTDLKKKKKLLYTCFPLSFAKYFRAPFLQNTSKRQLLQNIFLFFTSTLATKCDH